MSTRSAHLVRSLTAFVCVAVLAGCQGRRPTDAPWLNAEAFVKLMRMGVCRVVCDGGGGSAVPLDERHVLTARHVLSTPLRAVNDVPVNWPVVGWPDETLDWNDDWAVLELDRDLEFEHGFPILDDSWTPRVGDHVYLRGYWGGPDPGPGPAMGPAIIEGRVVAPGGWPPECVAIDTGRQSAFEGMSGGPAAIWDPQEREWRVVGIFLGYMNGYQVVRLLPDWPATP